MQSKEKFFTYGITTTTIITLHPSAAAPLPPPLTVESVTVMAAVLTVDTLPSEMCSSSLKEMAAVSAFLQTPAPRPYPAHYMDTAMQTYRETCKYDLHPLHYI